MIGWMKGWIKWNKWKDEWINKSINKKLLNIKQSNSKTKKIKLNILER